jgi:hypothetical protein
MPSYQIKQNSIECPLVFLMVQSSDHITGLTGASPTVTISKAGGAFSSPSGAVSEFGSGWYKVAANATDSGTLGPLLLHATATGGDPVDALYEVIAFDPQDAVHFGLSALPNAAAAASGGLPTVGTGSGQINPSSGNVTVGGYASGQAPPTAASIATASAAAILATPANLLATDSSGRVLLQPTQTGVTIPTVTTITNAVAANVTQWGGNNIAIPNFNGVPKVDVAYVQGQAAAISNGTAQAGAAGTITLASGEPAITDFYKGRQITIVSGTAFGQARFITAYNGTTKVATVHRNWDVIPDTTSQYAIDDLIEVDVRSWTGSAVATPATAGYPVVTHKVGTGTGEINVSAGKVPATLAATDVAGTVASDIQTIKGQAVTCNAGVAVGPYVGNGASPISVDGSGRVQIQSGTGAGQLSITSGVVSANTTQFGGQSVVLDSNNLPSVNAKDWNGTAISTSVPNTASVTVSAINSGIAAADVWNAVRSSYASTGSFGEGVASVQGNVAGPVGSIGGVTFPANFSALAIASTGQVGIDLTSIKQASSSTTLSNITIPIVTNVANASLNLSQPVPTSNSAQTVGDALNAARAQGFGKWVLSGTSLMLYAADGTTVVRTFTLDSASAPTTRS